MSSQETTQQDLPFDYERRINGARKVARIFDSAMDGVCRDLQRLVDDGTMSEAEVSAAIQLTGLVELAEVWDAWRDGD